MDYKEKYEKALERARKLNADNMLSDEAIEEIFPELSEDERIRLFICDLITRIFWGRDWNISKKDCLAYLEKQKEPRDYRKLYKGVSQSEWFKENYEGKSLGEEQKPEGCSEDEKMWRKLMDHLDWHSNNRLTHEECDELRAWLEGQKPTECNECAMFLSGECTHPNGKCKNVKPKQEWSEEDEKMLNDILGILHSTEDAAFANFSEQKKWLKSLRPQSKQEWSESDTLMCNAALALLRSHPNLMASNGINKSSIIRWLQSFRPQRQGFIDDICSKAGISIPYLDGNQWCILKGDDIQSGVVGFGDTKEDALANFIKDVPIQHEQQEIGLEEFTQKMDAWKARYNHPDNIPIKATMAFTARMFYMYPNIAREWYAGLPKATQD